MTLCKTCEKIFCRGGNEICTYCKEHEQIINRPQKPPVDLEQRKKYFEQYYQNNRDKIVAAQRERYIQKRIAKHNDPNYIAPKRGRPKRLPQNPIAEEST